MPGRNGVSESAGSLSVADLRLSGEVTGERPSTIDCFLGDAADAGWEMTLSNASHCTSHWPLRRRDTILTNLRWQREQEVRLSQAQHK